MNLGNREEQEDESTKNKQKIKEGEQGRGNDTKKDIISRNKRIHKKSRKQEIRKLT